MSNGGGTISVADNDNDSQNEIQDLLLSSNQLTITNNPAATIINLSPYLGNNLTEEDVDNMVANNGYLITELDGSITNEIQDLNLTGNTLSITNNAAPTNIDLTPYQNVFETTNGVTSNENGNYATDDFVFGSPSLEDNANPDHNNRFMFDKANGAFRAGGSLGMWDNRGLYSAAFGYGSNGVGMSSFASGLESYAFGSYSIAMGYQSLTYGTGSVALGYNALAADNYCVAIGNNAHASQDNSVCLGYYSNTYSPFSVSIGVGNTASSYGETILGMYSYPIGGVQVFSLSQTDPLFTIGNGTGDLSRSNALVMLKNGSTRLHGQLTIDADNVTGVGEPYTLPGQDGAANQVMTTDGNGNVSWNTPTTLTETDVDNFVSNNGYLTTEVDGSITNEIQDLNLTGNLLSITNNATATNIDLTPYQNVFETTNNVTSNENGNYATDDFVFGSPQLAYVGNSAHRNRMFFDKSKGAFRAGRNDGNQWDDANVGSYSTGFGLNVRASGDNSVALGNSAIALGATAIAIGTQTSAIGHLSVSIGTNSQTTGTSAIAMGTNTNASNNYATAIGFESQASEQYSFAAGYRSIASGFESMAFGHGAISGFGGGWYSVSVGRNTIATHDNVAVGYSTRANGYRSFASGVYSETNGWYSSALGFGTRTGSVGETAVGRYNTDDPGANPSARITTNRLFVIGNGINGNSRSDALIMLNNGNTRLHGLFTIDADNVTGAGEQYTLPGQDGAANQVMTTDGSGNVSWNTPAILTENDVDNFVSNNGYLTTEVDGSITNEIQDLNLTGNTLSITNNPTPTNIDLTPYQNVFETTNGVTSNENGNYATDDFVFGSPVLENDWNVNHRSRMFFDKSKAAFRAGYAISVWDDNNVGQNSVAFGLSTIAQGNFSFAQGIESEALGNGAIAMGVNAVASGVASISIGENTTSTAERSISLGYGADATGNYSFAGGFNPTASSVHAFAFGFNALASGGASLAIGSNNVASGVGTVSLGLQNYARSFGEMSIGLFNTDLNPPLSTNSWAAMDRLVVIGNGQSAANRSNALVMLKNGNTRLHGQLTIDADNVNGAGEQYTLPGQDGTANQVMTTDGNGNVNWSTPITLTETDVDNFVGNNGYLTSEVDGSVTNEIQDLNLTGNILSITNNAAPTNIDLTPYQNVFETTNNVTSNENGNYATDDFVFGSPQLDNNGQGIHYNRLFFDKSGGSFRAGMVNGSQWDQINRGAGSAAFGYNTRASGLYSFAAGFQAIASGVNTVSIGLGTEASGNSSFAIGSYSTASGLSSKSFGNSSQAIGSGSLTLGNNSIASGTSSISSGFYSISRAYGEFSTGVFNTDYLVIDPTVTNLNDRIFVVGNGSNTTNRSDALSIFRDGNTRLHGQLTIDADNVNGAGEQYTLPGQDGSANQVLITDGNGNVNWSTPTTLTESDVDNFVSNNGYLTTEMDGSITNEIQDLNLTGNTLSITNNTAPTNIDLTPYQNVFETTNGVTSNENGSYTTDSFVIGSPSLDDDGDGNHDTRLLFEKSTGAFRVGTVNDTRWDAAERGTNSVAMGLGNIARGGSSLSLGQNNLAHSASSVAIGTNNVAEGYNSIALGRNVATTGVHSMALSLYSASRSYGETTMGIYAADYVPNSTTNFDGNDRLFTIGNGLDDANRSNAFVILKNGDATLLGTLTDASDMRLKRNIKPLQNSLFSLNNLQGVHYQWNGRKPQDTVALQTGLIAQEVEKIFPELVKTDEEGFKSVNYIGLVPHLIEAIKELKQENEILKSESQKQREENIRSNEALEARIRLIENLLSQGEKESSDKSRQKP